jgi:hypothetical protein
MAEFRRIRLHATLESDVMLLTESEVERAIDGVYGRLKGTGLNVVTLEPEEVVSGPAPMPAGYDD